MKAKSKICDNLFEIKFKIGERKSFNRIQKNKICNNIKHTGIMNKPRVYLHIILYYFRMQ